MEIGRIVKSNSHVEFVCQVWGPGEIDDPPDDGDYGFGTLVLVQLDGTDPTSGIVGVVFDTILHNPEFGSQGPRLTPVSESPVLAPDRLAETAILAGILALGTLGPDGARHGVGAVSAKVGASVHSLDEARVRAFHLPDDKFAVGYVPHLLAHQHPLIGEVLLSIAAQLSHIFPDESSALAVIRDNLAWQMKVLRSR